MDALGNGVMGIDRGYHPETGQMAYSEMLINGQKEQFLDYVSYDVFGNLTQFEMQNRIGGLMREYRGQDYCFILTILS